MTDTFTCVDCGQVKPTTDDGGTGYAVDNEGKGKVCYACCGVRDRKDMIEHGKATLYLTMPGKDVDMGVRQGKEIKTGKVGNWPGTLTFTLNSGAVKVSRHNIAGKRYDVWFTGPDGATWHGVTYGDNTQLCHCRRTKAK